MSSSLWLLFVAGTVVCWGAYGPTIHEGQVTLGKNPWKANSLEWVAPSPPPNGNFAEMPTVYRGPYEYSVPGREDDYWPQNSPD